MVHQIPVALKITMPNNVSTHMSFLEMLDGVNEQLEREGKEPITFDHDCREGICGSCGFMINGKAHGHMARTTTCQLHMREFKDGEVLVIEPFRASGFPVMKDLDGRSFCISIGSFSRVDMFQYVRVPHQMLTIRPFERSCRFGFRGSCLHWMWCMRCDLSQCFCDALHRSES